MSQNLPSAYAKIKHTLRQMQYRFAVIYETLSLSVNMFFFVCAFFSSLFTAERMIFVEQLYQNTVCPRSNDPTYDVR